MEIRSRKIIMKKVAYIVEVPDGYYCNKREICPYFNEGFMKMGMPSCSLNFIIGKKDKMGFFKSKECALLKEAE